MKLKLVILSIVFLLAGCSNLSKKTSFTVEKNIVYKIAGYEKIFGDLYRPENSEIRAAVMVIHGGGWSKRSGDMESICKDLAGQGYLAFNVTYRLAPAHKYPAALEDVEAALKYLRDQSVKWNIDPDRIYVWGYSAGAHLALLLGLNPANNIKGIVAGAAPTNFMEYPKSPLINDFMGKSIDEAPELWKKASPQNNISEKSPPIYMYHGQWDRIVGINQMWEMKEKLESFKVPVTTKAIAYNGHLGVYLFSQSAVDQGIEFIKTIDR